MLYCIYNIALAGHAVNREVYGVRRGLFRSRFKGPKSNVMKKMFKVQGFKSSTLRTIEKTPRTCGSPSLHINCGHATQGYEFGVERN
jgi:hypothetical protein